MTTATEKQHERMAAGEIPPTEHTAFARAAWPAPDNRLRQPSTSAMTNRDVDRSVVTTILLSVVLGVFALPSFARAADAKKAGLGVDNLHGPTEFLRHSLMQSAEEARLLAAARRQLAAGDGDLAFQALQAVFAQPHDAFTPVFPGKPSASTWRAAFELLRTAGFRVRARWTAAMGGPAAEELRQAAAAGDSAAIASVAARYPLTEAGMQAMSMSAILAHTRGQTALADALLSEMEFTYGSTSLTFETQPTLTTLRHRIRNESSRPEHESRFAGEEVLPKPDQLVLPWPEPLWQWQESSWKHSQVASVFGGLTLPENRALLTLNSWRPVLTADTIVLRTPVRIIAFDKLSGHTRWMIRTDTLAPVVPFKTGRGRQYPTSGSSLSELLQMDDLGMLTVSDSFLFFVDHFRRYQSKGNLSPSRNNFQQPNIQNNLIENLTAESTTGGTRLVCVRLKPTPEVIWTAGDAPAFDYAAAALESDASVETSIRTGSNAPAATETVAADSPFSGQHFLGAPLAFDQMLFVLSADSERAFLNCMTQASGRILWQKPIAYHNEPDHGIRSRYLTTADESPGASLCGIDGDVVVCALKNGVVVGTRMIDGQLLWATNFRDEQEQSQSMRALDYIARASGSADAGFQPLINSGRMVWAAPQSNSVRCIDTQTGRILWTVAREATGEGSLEGSVDSYGVAADDSSVIMIGSRHLRALSTADGTQRWIAETQRHSGRAFCNERTCLVPQLDGSLALFDTQTGDRISVSSQFAFAEEFSFAGTVCSDSDILCCTTPLSVRVLPTCRLMYEKGKTGPPGKDAPGDQLTTARLHLLAGNRQDGLAALVSLIDSVRKTPEPDADLLETAESLLAETILRELTDRKDGAATMDPDLMERLALNLTAEQRLRYQLARPDKSILDAAETAASRLLLRFTPDWQARADVAAYASLSADAAQKMVPAVRPDSTQIDEIERAILFPNQIGSTQQQVAYAQMLIDHRSYSAAELFLVAAIRAAGTSDRPALQAVRNHLRDRRDNVDSDRVIVTDSEIRIDEQISLTPTGSLTPVLDIASVGNAAAEMPDWCTDRVLMVGSSFHSINMTSGAVSVPRKLPASANISDVRFRDDVPGLLPLTGNHHVGVLSLVDPVRPRLLWWKRVQKGIADPSAPEVGPLGADHMIVATRSQIQCLHPLTGRLLWQQQLSASLPSRSIFQRTVRIVGDHRVVGVFGQKSGSCTLFRTMDGKELGVTPLSIPDGQVPLVSGRMVLYRGPKSLVLVDLLTGNDVLRDKQAISVLNNGRAQLLRNHRAAVITKEGALVVLNLADGTTDLRCPLGKDFEPDGLVGMKIVERDQKLFLLARDVGNYEQQLSASSKVGDPRLDSGTLYCIDADSGKRLWQRASVPSVMPQVYGDPCNLLILWSWKNPGGYRFQRRLGGLQQNEQGSSLNEQRSLQVTVVNADTGKTVAEGHHFSPVEPVRCVHHANRKTIELHGRTSLITIRYEQ